MKKALSLFLFFMLSVNNALGSPLIFTIAKEISAGGIFEIAAIDTAKYRQIRIAVKSETKSNPAESARLIQRRTELAARLRDLKLSFKETHPEVLSKQKEIDSVEIGITRLNEIQDAAIFIVAVENGEEIPLLSLDKTEMSKSFIIDSPPTKTKILVKGQGKYSIYIWGQ